MAVGGLSVSVAAGVPAAHEAVPVKLDAVQPREVILVDDISPEAMVPLDPEVPIQRHYYAPGLGEILPEAGEGGGTAAGPPSTVVYANTRSALIFPPGANRLIADDVFSTALGGCDVSQYELLVGGGGDGTGSNGFSVDFAIYDRCPGTGGQPVPGTEGTMTFDDNGTHLVIVDLSGAPVPIDSTFWIGASFSRNGAGWAVGMQADVGFTEDIYHHPNFPCAAGFSGTIYAGFYAEVTCAGIVDTQFLAYLNNGSGTSTVQGANITVADDVELIVNECMVTGYEVGLTGGGGAYLATLELWGDCNAASAIPGTQFIFEGVGDGSVEVARVTLNPPVALANNVFWVAITPDRAGVGPVVSGEPVLGTTQDLFAVWNQPGNPGACNFFFFGGSPVAGFSINVFCQGVPPVGACCQIPPPQDGTACTVTSEFACSSGSWLEGTTCETAPFDPPCGTAACCLPDDTCDNLSEATCLAAGGAWDGDAVCDRDGQSCPFFACVGGQGDCCGDRPSETGCGVESCCDAVCRVDPWCCQVEWDQFCGDEAESLCNIVCAFGTIGWIDPLSGAVDARQPFAPEDANLLQGIDRITVSGPTSAGQTCCWSLCETAQGAAPNAIDHIEQNTDGTFAVVLSRPITPGAVTSLTYVGSGATASFTSHPANVNGDAAAGPSDVLALIDCLNGLDSCPWDLLSCDMDHSGACAPPDILRVIDLLNGAASFAAWNDTALPAATGDCP